MKIEQPLKRAARARQLSVRGFAIAAGMVLSLGPFIMTWTPHALAQVNQLVASCTITDPDLLASDVAAATGATDVEVAFVVVYSLNNDNSGQRVAGGFTGPVLCANSGVVTAPTATPANQQIPTTGTIDILDSAESFLLRYQEAATNKARFCHTTNENVDCFAIGPLP